MKGLIDVMESKSGKLLSRVFHLCWFLLFSILFMDTLRVNRHYTRAIVCGVAAFAVVAYLYPYCKNLAGKWEERRMTATAVVLLAVQFVLLLIAGRYLCSQPFNDAGTVYYSAVEILQTGTVGKEINEYTSCAWATGTSNNEYFIINEVVLFMVAYILPYLELIVHVLGIDPYTNAAYYAMIVLNCISITAATAVGYAVVKRTRAGSGGGLLFLVLSLLFAPNYLNTYKVYSDTLSMPYIMLAFLFLLLGNQGGGRNKWVYQILTGIMLAIGYLIKGSVIVLLVAMGVYLLLEKSFQDGQWKKTAMSVVCLFSAFAMVLMAWGSFQARCPWIDRSQQERYELPAFHWIMMAASGDGGYSKSDFDYSLSFEDPEERQEAIINRYIEKVRSYGSAVGYVDFIRSKLAVSLADGRYYQQVHMNQTFNKEWRVGRFVNQDGEYYELLMQYLKAYTYMLYAGCLVSALIDVMKGRVDTAFCINLCFFGLILFFSFWEFKSRYLMNYTPMFIMGFVLTMNDLRRILDNRRKRYICRT